MAPHLVEHTKTHVVARRNGRGGRTAAEHLIAALRCLYRHAEDDGLITAAVFGHQRRSATVVTGPSAHSTASVSLNNASARAVMHP